MGLKVKHWAKMGHSRAPNSDPDESLDREHLGCGLEYIMIDFMDPSGITKCVIP